MSVHEDLAALLGEARWFGGKGRDFAVTATRLVGVLPGGPPRVEVRLVQVEYADGDAPELYQVPLALYPEREERLSHALVGIWEGDDARDALGVLDGRVHAYDALHDREAMGLWLAAFHSAGKTSGRTGAETEGGLRFHHLADHEIDLTATSTLFTGEQSNSSVRFGDDAIMKVFRKITPGTNPDISIHDVLTRAGSDHVAALYGWVEVRDTGGAHLAGQGHEDEDDLLQLAMLQQFLRTASDGWELAQGSVRDLFAEGDLHPDEVGGDFAGEAARLGTALRETHQALAEHFPTSTRGRTEMAALAAHMHRRLDEALGVAPALSEHEELLRATFEAVAGLADVPVQTIHGDLHLGQTLRTVRGWKIVDFEGEPARPLAERQLPDSVWRDVAGMLRSFDYAPRVAAVNHPGDEGREQRAYRAREWSTRNQDAFLEAYAGGPRGPQEQALLAAHTADKAVYEAVYEARNRPGWLEIPLAGIAELARDEHAHESGDTA